MKDKTVVMTGATSGIGEVAALRLAAKGARIVMIARDEKRADATLRRLEKAGPGLGHALHFADLSSMAETRRVGHAIAAEEPRIDVLINNAGAISSRRQVTPEGLERTFALNHMAYFVLTDALMPRLIASAPARIVSTSSIGHIYAELHFDDLQSEKRFGYAGWRAYNLSKLSNILFTRELARRLEGTGVVANCVHPGLVASRFADGSGGITGLLFPILKRFGVSTEEGADSLVWLASAHEAQRLNGEYVVKRKARKPSPTAQDDAAAKRMWAESEKLAGG